MRRAWKTAGIAYTVGHGTTVTKFLGTQQIRVYRRPNAVTALPTLQPTNGIFNGDQMYYRRQRVPTIRTYAVSGATRGCDDRQRNAGRMVQI